MSLAKGSAGSDRPSCGNQDEPDFGIFSHVRRRGTQICRLQAVDLIGWMKESKKPSPKDQDPDLKRNPSELTDWP